MAIIPVRNHDFQRFDDISNSRFVSFSWFRLNARDYPGVEIPSFLVPPNHSFLLFSPDLVQRWTVVPDRDCNIEGIAGTGIPTGTNNHWCPGQRSGVLFFATNNQTNNLVTGTVVEVDPAGIEIYRAMFDANRRAQTCYYNPDGRPWSVSMFANDDRNGYFDNGGTLIVRVLVFDPANI